MWKLGMGRDMLRALVTPAVDCRGRQAPQQQEVRLSQLARHRQALSHTDTDTVTNRHRQTRTQTSLHEAQKRCERCRASANDACLYNRNQVNNTSRQKFLAGDLMIFSLLLQANAYSLHFSMKLGAVTLS